MELIFHEKQEGYLCAQHCLNALLQGPYFTPVDLATLAKQMDEEERKHMAENGPDSEEYRKFLEQPSGNYDDSGYFSVQVITSALNVWNLELVPYNSSEPRALEAQASPQNMQAFICNYRDHWFTIRRIGKQWFNLNSLLTGPELISDTYLSVYLAQLQHEGYSIFVVFGKLPECQAHEVLLTCPAVQSTQPKRVQVANSSNSSDDPDLQRAIRLSLGQNPSPTNLDEGENVDDESDDDLQRALQESVQDAVISKSPVEPKVKQVQAQNRLLSGGDIDDDLQRALRLSLQQSDSTDSELDRALQMSLECMGSDGPTVQANSVDVADLRARRLMYLEASSSHSGNKSSSSTS